MRLPMLKSAEDLAALVEDVGFLPFFKGEIAGFSVEECTPPELWFSDLEGPWEWKGPVIGMTRCAYGKFYRGRAVYIARRYFPDFANFRRDGYDFDARMDEGLVRRSDVPVMQALWKTPVLVSKELKARVAFGRGEAKAIDGVLTRLQMMAYVNIAGFVYPLSKTGEPYGWGLAQYTTPEAFFGEEFTRAVYKVTPARSLERLLSVLGKILPAEPEERILRFLRGIG